MVNSGSLAVLEALRLAYAGELGYGNNSMYDFASHITAGEKLPSLAFGFKPFDTTVLKHYPPVPECVKLAVGCGIYSVIRIFVFLGHGKLPVGSIFPTKSPELFWTLR